MVEIEEALAELYLKTLGYVPEIKIDHKEYVVEGYSYFNTKLFYTLYTDRPISSAQQIEGTDLEVTRPIYIERLLEDVQERALQFIRTLPIQKINELTTNIIGDTTKLR